MAAHCLDDISGLLVAWSEGDEEAIKDWRPLSQCLRRAVRFWLTAGSSALQTQAPFAAALERFDARAKIDAEATGQAALEIASHQRAADEKRKEETERREQDAVVSQLAGLQ